MSSTDIFIIRLSPSIILAIITSIGIISDYFRKTFDKSYNLFRKPFWNINQDVMLQYKENGYFFHPVNLFYYAVFVSNFQCCHSNHFQKEPE